MSETKKCLFCDEKANYVGLNTLFRVGCPNCGVYIVTDIIADEDQDIVKIYAPYKHLISGLIREKNDMGLQIETISLENIMSITNDALIPKTIMQKLDKILLHYYRKSKTYGTWLTVDQSTPYSIGYAINHEELINMIKTLVESEFFTDELNRGDIREFSISFKGVSRAEGILSTNKFSKKVFVAMGFKEDLLEAHKMAIQPACRECGLDAFLVIEKEHNGDITDKIISEIKTSKFVITDFTYNNQGAYFEAGYAQGRGLEVIRTCNKEWFDGVDENGEKNYLHFDINHYNFILWENCDDLKEKLINRIRATIL